MQGALQKLQLCHPSSAFDAKKTRDQGTAKILKVHNPRLSNDVAAAAAAAAAGLQGPVFCDADADAATVPYHEYAHRYMCVRVRLISSAFMYYVDCVFYVQY